ncbi:transglycosylase domain-containing protein [Azospirillum sp. SYSU D00513]|uniref:transglycosylase domain-containing protein n=1 Tax=Azospirillum sp. SYSU D00513 TaxID=2812561 RepID=UPI001A96E378|nr:transglycosylase domain-containing protein [Azospirillum sp. SYSU D00513]
MPRTSFLRRLALSAALALPLSLGAWSAHAPAQAQGASFELFGESFRSVDEILKHGRGGGVRFHDRQGRFLGTVGERYGDMVPLEKLPKHLVQALIAKEDRRFLEHGGLDYQGLARALAIAATSGRFSQGGSTLTQQTMKLIFLKDYDRWTRKALELYSANEFEDEIGKRNVLYLYLNRAYFGFGAYGVDAAARIYFAKSAGRLSLKESALLIGSLPAPARLNVFNDAKRAEEKAAIVLDTMVEAGFITKSAAEQAKRQRPMLAQEHKAAILASGHFRETAKTHFDRFAKRHYRGEEKPDATFTVRTTLDLDLQEAAVRAVDVVTKRRAKAMGDAQVALVAMDGDGEVLAMIGGRDFAARRDHFNRALLARRQPGSTFKLFVYLAALERGLTPASPVDGSRLTFANGTTIRNFDNRYDESLTLAEALAHSTNTAAVRLTRGHEDEVVAVARRLGVTSPLTGETGLALGASETTLLEMTRAYATVANGGFAVSPHLFRAITDPDGKELFAYDGRKRERVIAPEHATAMRAMLSGVLTGGTGRAARVSFPAGGKTGTTNDYRDALFVGFANGITVGVWVGNDNNTPMRSVNGGSVPAEIWRAFMIEAAKLGK